MRRKKVWRYYCDFCKKANCSGASIKKHESRCTLNPSRHCGFCDILENGQPTNMNEAMTLLPTPDDFLVKDGYLEYYSNEFTEKAEAAMSKVRELLNDCPACILSVIRRKGIPVPSIKSFDFQKESESAWAEFNENQRHDDEYPMMNIRIIGKGIEK